MGHNAHGAARDFAAKGSAGARREVAGFARSCGNMVYFVLSAQEMYVEFTK